MSGAIQIHQEPMSFASDLPAVLALAKALINGGGFLPVHIKSEGEVVAVVLAGRELGIPPMASIRSLRLISGQVVLAADLQLGLMIRAGITYKWIEDGRAGRAVLEVKRVGQEPYTSIFEIADAERAGLIKPASNWAKHPAAMLRARAVSGAGKAYMPDVLAGVYVPGELGEDEQSYEPPTERPKTLHLSESTRTAEVPQTRPIETATVAMDTNIPTRTQTPTSGLTGGPSSTAIIEPTKAERLTVLLEVRLPAATENDFVAIARELLELHGPVRGSKGWRMFRDACASHEVSPSDVIEEAQKLMPVQQEAAQ